MFVPPAGPPRLTLYLVALLPGRVPCTFPGRRIVAGERVVRPRHGVRLLGTVRAPSARAARAQAAVLWPAAAAGGGIRVLAASGWPVTWTLYALAADGALALAWLRARRWLAAPLDDPGAQDAREARGPREARDPPDRLRDGGGGEVNGGRGSPAVE